jgi:hypothetical protein
MGCLTRRVGNTNKKQIMAGQGQEAEPGIRQVGDSITSQIGGCINRIGLICNEIKYEACKYVESEACSMI